MSRTHIARTGLAPQEKPAQREPGYRSNIRQQLGEGWLAKYEEAETLMKEALQLMTTGGDPDKVASVAGRGSALYAQVMGAFRGIG